MAMTNIV